ncbi:MAG: zinc-ribbon domain-containing protein [Nitrospinae bacterium]|nr:zinc-ribbon domain-containing protein [Nitrospinota bacterium]
MILITEIAILALTLLFIAYPLYNRRAAQVAGAGVEESELTDLLYKKEAVYIALKDLDFDYKMGKIDDADYQEMKTRFESDAVALLGKIDELEAGVSSKAERRGTAPIAGSDRFCVKCGAKIGADFNFCGKCGAVVPKL